MHTDAKRFYALLGLDPTCSDEDIRIAFRRRAKELHPDAETGNAVAFIRLKRAYDTLSNPGQRVRYDRSCTPRVRRAMRAEPPMPRVRPRRHGGMSVARYLAAFIFVGGLSFGAIEAMISYNDVPPAGSASPAAREVAKGGMARVERSASGFWDPSSPDGTPRDAADHGEPARPAERALGRRVLE